ncbi:hypothetical protein AB4505_23350, partial [Vibrio splendidus]
MFNVKSAALIFIIYLIPSSYSLAEGGCFTPVQLKDGSTSYLDESMKESSLNIVKVIKKLIPMDYKFKFKQFCVLGGCSQTSESSFVKLMYGVDISAIKVYSESKKLVINNPSGRSEGEVLFSLIDNYSIYEHGYELSVDGEPLDDAWRELYNAAKDKLKTERLDKSAVKTYLDGMYTNYLDAEERVINVIEHMKVNEPALVALSGEDVVPFVPDSGHMVTIVKDSDSTFILINN